MAELDGTMTVEKLIQKLSELPQDFAVKLYDGWEVEGVEVIDEKVIIN